jgi:hypothetical protein
MRATNATFILACFSLFTFLSWGQDDPNEFNQIMGLSVTTTGPQSISDCGWEESLSRNGSDGGQLTITINTCLAINSKITSFPQTGGAGGKAELEPDDLIIVWDEDEGHGELENKKNFDFTGVCRVLEDSEYADYLRLTRTDSRTNWAVYKAVTAGTFTKGTAGTNEHEVINQQLNMMHFFKYDDVEDCVSPDDEIEYTICFDNPFFQTVQNPFVIDWLPEDVFYPRSVWSAEFTDPNDPNTLVFFAPDPGYNKDDHSYVWFLNDIDPNASGCLQLAVVVKDTAPPGGFLHNVAELWGTVMVSNDPNDPNTLTPEVRFVAKAVIDTRVCCYAPTPEILYVDRMSSGGNGSSWSKAYNDLQDALDYARTTICDQVQSIYVAQGTYSPGDKENDSFDLTELPGIALYGGFPTGGCDFSMRNPKRYQTPLSGRIDDMNRNTTVLRMGNNTYVEGFTITGSGPYPDGIGIYGLGVNFTVVDCKIDRNEGYGAFIENANATFKWCKFVRNKSDGISHTGEDYSLILENCVVQASGQYGITCKDSTPHILNSIVAENDFSRQGRAGIYMENPKERPYIQNCTVSHNKTDGIVSLGNRLPNIHNSIVFHNGGPALVGFSADEAAMYSCIEDANSINGNINVDPEFLYFDPNNVRLSPESNCRHASNPYLEYGSQMDMDGNSRVTSVGLPPDMGAYEVVCDINVSNTWDWNADGLVNYLEFNGFSKAWMGHDPNDPAWLANPAIRDPNLAEGWYEWKYKYNVATAGDSAYSVDLADVLYFAEESPWLWRACWVNLEDTQMQQMMPSGGEELMMFMQSETEVPAVEEKSVQEQVFDLVSAMVFLEQIWFEEPDLQQEISSEEWQGFMDALRLNLFNIQTGTLQTE